MKFYKIKLQKIIAFVLLICMMSLNNNIVFAEPGNGSDPNAGENTIETGDDGEDLDEPNEYEQLDEPNEYEQLDESEQEEIDELDDDSDFNTETFSLMDLGSGTIDDPYLISRPEHFGLIVDDINAYYTLASDIDFEGGLFESVGNFSGNFDGKGHTLSNLKVIPRFVTGIFGFVNNATIKNLVIDNVHIDAKPVSFSMSAGILAGYISNSTIENVSVKNSTISSNGSNIGGLIGFADAGSVTDCSVYNTSVSGSSNIGGLIGNSSGTLSYISPISECYAVGDVVGARYVGGLIGNAAFASISNCFALGSVVSSTNSLDTGGLLGSLNNRTNVTNCYAANSVSRGGSGFLPIRNITFTEYNSLVSGHYYDSIIFGSYNPSYTLKTPAMLRMGTFLNWDFNNIWDINENKTYPYLRSIGEPSWPDYDRSFWPSGSGTAADPYLISKAEHLNFINNDDSAYYELINDIDFEGGLFQPVGSFSGNFDGKGYTLSNLRVIPGFVTGIFAFVNNAAIKNLVIDDAHIDAKPVSFSMSAGIFAGNISNSTIENVSVKNSTISSNGGSIGGLIGSADAGSVTDCSVSNTSVSGGSNVGGLIGSTSTSITNCSVSGKVTVSGTSNTGGLIGRLNNGSINLSYAEASVTGGDNTGGLIGNVSGTSSYISPISECYAVGDVVGARYVGGLIGNAAFASISNCFALGSVVSSTNSLDTGGLLGSLNNQTSITNCYAANSVSRGGSGFLPIRNITFAEYNSLVSGHYYDSVLYGAYHPTYTIKTPAMLRKGTYTNWDFNSIWDINENKTYPYLRSIGEPSWPDYDRSFWPGGSGTAANPYLLNKAEHFKFIDYDSNAFYALSANIDFGNQPFTPINFFGSLDGREYALRNINIDHNPNAMFGGGIFSYIEGATIKNLIIENANVSAGSNSGILAGYVSNCVIDNVSIRRSSIVSTGGNVGALAGLFSGGSIRRCSVLNNSAVSGRENIGGLVGHSFNSSITDSYSQANVTSTINHINTGGLLGRVGSSTTIRNCYAAGSLSSGGSGLAPEANTLTVISSYFDSTRAGITTPSNQARTTTQMRNRSTYSFWDFDNIWDIPANSYPVLYPNTGANVTSINISGIEGSTPNVRYNQGPRRRINNGNDLTVIGVAFNGSIVARYAYITVTIKNNDWLAHTDLSSNSVTVRTDSQGNFTATVRAPQAAGFDSYLVMTNPTIWHAYDLGELIVSSGTARYREDIYIFARSIFW